MRWISSDVVQFFFLVYFITIIILLPSPFIFPLLVFQVDIVPNRVINYFISICFSFFLLILKILLFYRDARICSIRIVEFLEVFKFRNFWFLATLCLMRFNHSHIQHIWWLHFLKLPQLIQFIIFPFGKADENILPFPLAVYRYIRLIMWKQFIFANTDIYYNIRQIPCPPPYIDYFFAHILVPLCCFCAMQYFELITFYKFYYGITFKAY